MAHMRCARAFCNARDTFRERSTLPRGGSLCGWAHRCAQTGDHVDEFFLAAIVVGERIDRTQTICDGRHLTFTHTPPGPQPCHWRRISGTPECRGSQCDRSARPSRLGKGVEEAGAPHVDDLDRVRGRSCASRPFSARSSVPAVSPTRAPAVVNRELPTGCGHTISRERRGMPPSFLS